MSSLTPDKKLAHFHTSNLGLKVTNLHVCCQTRCVEEEEPPIPTDDICPISPRSKVLDPKVRW